MQLQRLMRCTSSNACSARKTAKYRVSKKKRLKFCNAIIGQPISPDIISFLKLQEDEMDPDKPIFHVMANQGWINDPNGPLYYNGKYHLFYQHVVGSAEWDWGIVWGHVCSEDLVHWTHMPPAIVPSSGSFDADGCFSGCAVVRPGDDKPVILYTGVRLRSNPDCGPLPPSEFDLQLPFIESQCMAVAVDDQLLTWQKDEQPFIVYPPPNLPLAGWRDPFIIQHGGCGNTWKMLLGTGLKNQGGAVMIYSSNELGGEWQYDGLLCFGELDTGLMWECPILLQLDKTPTLDAFTTQSTGVQSNGTVQDVSAQSSNGVPEGNRTQSSDQDPVTQWSVDTPQKEKLWFFCVSPDAPTNPTLYWLGNYDDQKFDLHNSKGPFRLDLGDVLYAPNILQDPQHKRSLCVGWIQERRKVGTYDYSGCMTTPRLLSCHGDRLIQQPLLEVHQLRKSNNWIANDLELQQHMPIQMQAIRGLAVDFTASFSVNVDNPAQSVGFVVKSWKTGGEGSVAIMYDFQIKELAAMFEVVEPESMQFSLRADRCRKIGGSAQPGVHEPDGVITLRVLLDHSVVEVFIVGGGEVLTTRIYRGEPPDSNDPGIEFITEGGNAKLLHVSAYEMSTIWNQA